MNTAMYQAFSGQDFGELLGDSSIVSCVCKHVHTPSTDLIPDDASCYDASRLSINTIPADFPSTCSAKLLFFTAATTNGRHMHKTLEQSPPPHFCLEVVCNIFGSLQ